jgi:uncharacterized protein
LLAFYSGEKMRRSDKEIKNSQEIANIMEKALVCRIALVDDDYPYIVPVNFVMRDNHLYFHSAAEGKKIAMLKKNNRVSFEADDRVEIVRGDSPCFWGTKYLSVIGFGRAFLIDEIEEKKKALNCLMEKYSGKKDFSYQEEALKKVIIVDVQVDNITGKKSGYK